MLSAIMAGASGYLLKQIRARDLVAALEAVGARRVAARPGGHAPVLERMRRIATGAARRDGAADRAGAEDPAARRRGQDEQGDRGRGLPVRQDREELRELILSKLNLERRAQAAAYIAKHRIGRGSPPASWRPGRPEGRRPPRGATLILIGPPSGGLRSSGQGTEGGTEMDKNAVVVAAGSRSPRRSEPARRPACHPDHPGVEDRPSPIERFEEGAAVKTCSSDRRSSCRPGGAGRLRARCRLDTARRSRRRPAIHSRPPARYHPPILAP